METIVVDGTRWYQLYGEKAHKLIKNAYAFTSLTQIPLQGIHPHPTLLCCQKKSGQIIKLLMPKVIHSDTTCNSKRQKLSKLNKQCSSG